MLELFASMEFNARSAQRMKSALNVSSGSVEWGERANTREEWFDNLVDDAHANASNE